MAPSPTTADSLPHGVLPDRRELTERLIRAFVTASFPPATETRVQFVFSANRSSLDMDVLDATADLEAPGLHGRPRWETVSRSPPNVRLSLPIGDVFEFLNRLWVISTRLPEYPDLANAAFSTLERMLKR